MEHKPAAAESKNLIWRPGMLYAILCLYTLFSYGKVNTKFLFNGLSGLYPENETLLASLKNKV